MNRLIALLGCLTFVSTAGTAYAAQIRYVDPDAPPDGTGLD